MKKQIIILFILLCGMTGLSAAQTGKFRSGIFLHHSTGGCIWGPNDSATGVPEEMENYNAANGYTGENAVSMTEQWWPDGDNEWVTWDNIFHISDATNDIRSILQNNKIVVIKSCFPSSDIDTFGSPSDTLNPENKTVFNYKWHWRNIINIMAAHPENFFAIWTNAPLVANATNSLSAKLSHQFCTWAKDTLAAGLDPQVSSFPSNVYVFDFFHKLADSTGMLATQYASDEWDSHPNAAATELVAPQFVQEIFDAAIAYENLVGVQENKTRVPLSFSLKQNYPNPFNPATTIEYHVKESCSVRLEIFNQSGRSETILVNAYQTPGVYKISFAADDLPSGIYFYRIRMKNFVVIKKMILLE